MSFNFIPPGSFIMGSRKDEENRLSGEDRHLVNVPAGYYLSTFPVTQGQWQATTGANPSRFPGDPTRPVEQVSWDECVSFCSRLGEVDGLRVCLPTEEVWEYACRAGTATQFHFGEALSAAQANFDVDHMHRREKGWGTWWGTTPVDRFPPNPWGLYDLHGNVWEWCQDWYEGFPSSLPDVFPPHGPFRGLRGGGWNAAPAHCRAGRRNRGTPGSGFHAFGFRVCLWPSERSL
jgi:formylglycine-generating enzyme